MTTMNDALHTYLAHADGCTAPKLWDELCRLRKHNPFAELPATGEAFIEALDKLRDKGLIQVTSNGTVIWVPKRVDEPRDERQLF
jgi:hypothetical protein